MDDVVVGVLGASGGLGASTLAVALAVRAGGRYGVAVAVDGDPARGGLDVTACLEHEAGLRWADLDRPRGRGGRSGPAAQPAGRAQRPLPRGGGRRCSRRPGRAPRRGGAGGHRVPRGGRLRHAGRAARPVHPRRPPVRHVGAPAGGRHRLRGRGSTREASPPRWWCGAPAGTRSTPRRSPSTSTCPWSATLRDDARVAGDPAPRSHARHPPGDVVGTVSDRLLDAVLDDRGTGTSAGRPGSGGRRQDDRGARESA